MNEFYDQVSQTVEIEGRCGWYGKHIHTWRYFQDRSYEIVMWNFDNSGKQNKKWSHIILKKSPEIYFFII